jgi:hypothetical protein
MAICSLSMFVQWIEAYASSSQLGGVDVPAHSLDSSLLPNLSNEIRQLLFAL